MTIKAKRTRVANGRGTLFQRAPGVCWIARWFKDGKRVERSTRTKDETEARRILRTFIGRDPRRFRLTAEEWAYLDTVAPPVWLLAFRFAAETEWPLARVAKLRWPEIVATDTPPVLSDALMNALEAHWRGRTSRGDFVFEFVEQLSPTSCCVRYIESGEALRREFLRQLDGARQRWIDEAATPAERHERTRSNFLHSQQ